MPSSGRHETLQPNDRTFSKCNHSTNVSGRGQRWIMILNINTQLSLFHNHQQRELTAADRYEWLQLKSVTWSCVQMDADIPCRITCFTQETEPSCRQRAQCCFTLLPPPNTRCTNATADPGQRGVMTHPGRRGVKADHSRSRVDMS